MKKFLALILSGIMMLSVAACSSGQTAENENTAGELQDFDIVLDWYPNAVHSFIYVAMEKGYYEEEGLNVNVQFPSNTNAHSAPIASCSKTTLLVTEPISSSQLYIITISLFGKSPSLEAVFTA